MEKAINNSPLRRIKYLMLMQMGDHIRRRKNDSLKKKAFIIFLKVVLAIVVTAALTFVFSYLQNTVHVKISKQLLVSLLIISQVISIISCTSNLLSVLYLGKDNTLLLAFPCSYGEIFTSKLAVFGYEELKKSVYFTLPFFISFGLFANNALYWVFLLPVLLISCLFPVIIGALISIPLIHVKRFFEKRVILTATLIVASLVLAFYGVTIILSKLPDPLRLIAIYGKFIATVEEFLISLSSWGLWYIFVGETMFNNLSILYFILYLLTFLTFTFIVLFVAKPIYFKAVSSSVEAGRTKKHKVKKHKLNNLFLTFFRKELTLFLRNSQAVTSAVFTIFLFPLISYVFNFVLVAINQNVLGEFMSIAFNVMITFSILSSNNANCASSISKEGSEFAVLKTAPTDTSVICWAKIAVTEIINVTSILTTVIVLFYTTTISPINIALLAILLIVLTTSHILWSFQLDIVNPQILQYATKGNEVINNPNVAKSVVIGFVISLLAGVTILLMFMENYLFGWIRVMLLAFAFAFFRLYLLNNNVKVYFNEIQM